MYPEGAGVLVLDSRGIEGLIWRLELEQGTGRENSKYCFVDITIT